MAEHDRRVRRTRRILVEALTALILEKGYERTTVKDILDRADVGRSTFYAHFRDKEALMLACFDGLQEALAKEFTAVQSGISPESAGPAAVVFTHAHLHRTVYKVLCGRKGSQFVHRHLNRLISHEVSEYLRPRAASVTAGLPTEIVAEFYASATVGLLVWWIEQDFRVGPDRMAIIHELLTGPCMKAALGAGGNDQ